MQIKRLLYSESGKIVISILLGLGLATLFRKVCKDKDCIVFKGPIMTNIDDKIYKYDNKCYKYSTENVSCDKSKRIIDITMGDDTPDILSPPVTTTPLYSMFSPSPTPTPVK
jgi:hypothetical protein